MPEKVWIEEPGVADPAPELEARGAEVGHELGHGAHRDPATNGRSVSRPSDAVSANQSWPLHVCGE